MFYYTHSVCHCLNVSAMHGRKRGLQTCLLSSFERSDVQSSLHPPPPTSFILLDLRQYSLGSARIKPESPLYVTSTCESQSEHPKVISSPAGAVQYTCVVTATFSDSPPLKRLLKSKTSYRLTDRFLRKRLLNISAESSIMSPRRPHRSWE